MPSSLSPAVGRRVACGLLAALVATLTSSPARAQAAATTEPVAKAQVLQPYQASLIHLVGDVGCPTREQVADLLRASGFPVSVAVRGSTGESAITVHLSENRAFYFVEVPGQGVKDFKKEAGRHCSERAQNIAVFVFSVVTPPPPLETWRDSFLPASVATYLRPDDQRVAVAAVAGEDLPSPATAASAVAAMREAVAQAGRLREVLDINAPPDADDETLIRAGADLDADVTLILRISPGVRAASEVAIGLLRNRDGSTRATFLVTRGNPLVARAESDPDAAPRAARAAKEKYDRLFIGVSLLGKRHYYYQGRDHLPLNDVALYRALGEEGLAGQAQQTHQLKTSLILGGIALCAVGIAGGAAGIGLRDRHSDALPAGISILGVGVAGGIGLLAAGLHLSAHPVGAAKLDELISIHNGALKREIGLSP